MIFIPVLTTLLTATGKEIVEWTDSNNRLWVWAISIVNAAVCPDCGGPSSQCHGLLWRTLTDCPSFGLAVKLKVQVGRFKCINPACGPRTFSELLEPLNRPGLRGGWLT